MNHPRFFYFFRNPKLSFFLEELQTGENEALHLNNLTEDDSFKGRKANDENSF